MVPGSGTGVGSGAGVPFGVMRSVKLFSSDAVELLQVVRQINREEEGRWLDRTRSTRR